MIQYAKHGLNSLTADASDSVRKFTFSQLNEDGGFAGRDGKSDIYYTVFGMQLLHALKLMPETKLSSCNTLSPSVLAALGGFVRSFSDNAENLDFVHLASLIRCSLMLQIETTSDFQSTIAQIEAYRSSDGGYNHLERNAEHATVYAGFLAYLAYQESGLCMPDSDKLIKSLGHLKRKDGSYANDCGMESGSTTATSAAMLLLNAFGENIEIVTINALLSRAHPKGGFLAGPASPVPDLLSTATALLALKTIAYDISNEQLTHREFISSLWNEDSGFSGHIFDDTSDCEYTFYALLALGTMHFEVAVQ